VKNKNEEFARSVIDGYFKSGWLKLGSNCQRIKKSDLKIELKINLACSPHHM
jgi:hypothetical protein